jgi:deazaflavin-dependent oxidoreductase (nitroreductase family)
MAVAERRAPGWLKWVNPVNRFLLKRGMGPAPQHLLTVAGRKSGTPHTTPVAVVVFGGVRYLVAGFDGSDWVKNARAARWGELRRGRAIQRVELEEVPLDQRAPILRLFAKTIRGGQSFLTVAAHASHEEFVAAGPRHPIFRLIPMDAGPAQ